MIKLNVLFFVLAANLLAYPLFAQTEIEKRFLLKQYEYGIDREIPVLRKYQLWNITKSGAPVEDRNWTVKIVKAANDMTTQKPIDFGPKQDRYVKFTTQYNNGKYPISLSPRVFKGTNTNLVIQMNLYEKDGKFVKTLSKYGTIVGISQTNFVYEAEGKQSILVTFETVTPGKNHVYEVSEAKLSNMLPYSFYEELTLGMKYKEGITEATIASLEKEYKELSARRIEAYVPMPVPTDPASVKAQNELQAACPLFRMRFTREHCASAFYNFKNNVNEINGFIPLKDCFTHSFLDWGHNGDRFLRFDPVWVPRRMGTNAALKDDVYGTKQAVVMALNLYESDGSFVKRVAFGCGCMMWGENNLFVRGENKDGWLFRTEKIKLNASGYMPSVVYSYKAIMSKYPADNLSQITKFSAFGSFNSFTH